MEQKFYTEDMGEIMCAHGERNMVREILNAWDDTGLPEDFDDSGVKFVFNHNSGNVFLVNDDYQCCMLSNGKLESFYTTPYEGIEGFWRALVQEYPSTFKEDREDMEATANGRELPNHKGTVSHNNRIYKHRRMAPLCLGAAYGVC